MSYLNIATEHFRGKLELVRAMRLINTDVDNQKLLILLDQAEQYQDQIIIKSDRAQLWQYRGEILYNMGDISGAKASLQKSIDIWPHPKNLSQHKLREILAQ